METSSIIFIIIRDTCYEGLLWGDTRARRTRSARAGLTCLQNDDNLSHRHELAGGGGLSIADDGEAKKSSEIMSADERQKGVKDLTALSESRKVLRSLFARYK